MTGKGKKIFFKREKTAAVLCFLEHEMWGILASDYDAFPASVVSDKLIEPDDSEVPQPPWCQVEAFSHHPPLILSEQTRWGGRGQK